MRILVTGTAGFIGYHVAEDLLRLGHEVIGVDNFNDYYSVRLKRDRHRRLEAHAGYQGFEFDLADPLRTMELFRTARPQRVCHLAAQAGVRYSLLNPHAYERSNLAAFVNVLEGCRHQRVERLVYASSSSVYGGNTKLPFAESDPVDHPISLYAATKKANELMAYTYTHLFGLATVGLRLFTVYGPWGRPDMAMWIFTERLIRGDAIPVFNYGRMRRDFTYIDDVVAGVRASLLVDGLEAYEVLNLGHHQPEELLHMIQILAQTLGVEPKMDLLPMQPGDIPATYAEIERARAKLGFEPRTPLSDGIREFVTWFREYHQL